MKPQTIGLVEDLYNMRVKQGKTEYELKKYLMSPPYNYSERNAQAYLKRLRIYIKENLTQDPVIEVELAIQELSEYRQKHKTDPKVYMEVSKEIYKLRQLYKEKLDITSNGETIIPQINIIVHKKDE